MVRSSDASRKLGIGLSQRFRRVYGLLDRKLKLAAWFPHIPLALAMGLLGFLQIAPALEHTLGLTVFSREVGSAARIFSDTFIRGLPHAVLGALLMVMSVGLLLRSRLAWIMAVLVTSASLALALLAPVRSASSLLTLYNSLLLVFLILGHRRFPRSSLAVATIFALTNAMLLLGLAVLGSYELGKDFSPPITDFGTAFYYAVVTMTTVGYGDILPRTPEARFFVSGIIILGITVFATSLSAILMPLINSRMQRLLQPGEGPMERTNHYVIFGDTALSRNSYKELQARNQPVTFILRRASEESLYQEADVVIGDGSDLDVLRRAGADKAKAVLALSDDDSENAFVILAARELAEGIKMVAVVNDAKNLNRMRRVQPDLIISPQVLGGELLAMALSGETFDSENLMERLFHFRRT